jgi:hypothetical protein
MRMVTMPLALKPGMEVAGNLGCDVSVAAVD